MDGNNILLRGILRYPFFMPAVGSTVWQQGAFQAVRLRAQILRRHTDLGAKAGRCVPRPVRIVEYRAGEGDQVGIAILQRRLRLLRVGDQPHANHRDCHLLANIAGERQLVSRPNGDRLLRRQTAAGDVNIVTAQRFQLLAKLNGLLAVPAATQSVADSLTPTAMVLPTASRIALKTSSG